MKKLIFLLILFTATSAFAAIQTKIEDITAPDTITAEGIIKAQKTIKIRTYEVDKDNIPISVNIQILTKERYDEVIAQNNAVIAAKQAENIELEKLSGNFGDK